MMILVDTKLLISNGEGASKSNVIANYYKINTCIQLKDCDTM